MSKTPERLVYDWISQNLPGKLHCQRIECTTTPGIPDINLIINGREIWMEVKALKELMEGGIRIRKEQYAWMVRRATLGARCVVFNRHQSQWQMWRMDAREEVVPAGAGHVSIRRMPDFSGITGTTLHEALESISKT